MSAAHTSPSSDPAPHNSVAAAIDLLEPGMPLELMDGLHITDNGHLILSRYIDIAPDKASKRAVRPPVLVKAIEQRYALEFSPTIQVSSPHRFREFGESFIQDDQEGHAKDEYVTGSQISYPERDSELQDAVDLLVPDADISIGDTKTNSNNGAFRALTFGKAAWIYCTSIKPTAEQVDRWREHLPESYDHESVIRQPVRFAFALASAFADQHGAQGQIANFDHAFYGGAIKSFHSCQMIMHGPVWYTDDVHGFLSTRMKDDSLYNFYSLFVKHTDYQDQLEYRFVLHCESPVKGETLRMAIKPDLLAALAPHGESSPVTYQRGSDPSPRPQSKTNNNSATLTKTRWFRNKSRRTLTDSAGGERIREEIQGEEKITVTSEINAPDGLGDDLNAVLESIHPGIGHVKNRTEKTITVADVPVAKEVTTRTAILPADQQTIDGLRDLFELDDLDGSERRLAAATKPFSEIHEWPPFVASLLEELARKTANLEPQTEVGVMSASWNAIWAVVNICRDFGDIVETIDIEEDKFIAILLRESETGAQGKLLVGPRGTFAYVLLPSGVHNEGGTSDRLIMFPDETARRHFTEAGWPPLVNTDTADTPADA